MKKKIKDNITLKELKKYGFSKSWAGFYVYADKDDFVEIAINPITKEIDCDDDHPVLKQMQLDNLIENAGDDEKTKNIEEHYHCDICEESYPTKKEAEECFKNHNENEHLRWVARETYYLKHTAYNLFKYIDFIENKYHIDD